MTTQRQVPANRVAQKTVMDPQTQSIDNVMDITVVQSMNAVVHVPVVVQHQAPMVQEVQIQVCKGERAVRKDNNLQCKFHLNDIPSAPRGAPQIEVFSGADVNENGRRSQSETDHMIQYAEKYHGGDDSGGDESIKTKIEAQQERQPHRSQRPTSTQVVQEREKEKRGKG